jgi:hypothetical protein
MRPLRLSVALFLAIARDAFAFLFPPTLCIEAVRKQLPPITSAMKTVSDENIFPHREAKYRILDRGALRRYA